MDRSGEVLVRARGLRKDYGRGEGLVRAVDHVDLEVARGEAVAVRGPSGCGKSTLLHLLGGLDRPTAGELWLGGRRIDRLSERALAQLRRHEVGFVFQAFHLMDELTAQENVELPALLAGRSPQEARRRARQLLERVGLADRADHLPSALSGGQRQRVAIARALANEPTVVLADEPTGNLDSAATLEVLRLFEALHEDGLTLVVVTHDERIAASADRLVSMRDGAFVGETTLTGPLPERAGRPRRAGRLSHGKAPPRLARSSLKDIRHRPVLTILLLLAIAAGAATLTLGLALRGTTDNPYARTRAATDGPDVVATDINGDSGPRNRARGARSISIGGAQPSDLAPLEHAPGVVAYSGPFPVTWAALQSGHTSGDRRGRGAQLRALRGRPAEADPGHLGPTRRSGRRGRRSRRRSASTSVTGCASAAARSRWWASPPRPPSPPIRWQAPSAPSWWATSAPTASVSSGCLQADVAHVAAAGSEPVFYT